MCLISNEADKPEEMEKSMDVANPEDIAKSIDAAPPIATPPICLYPIDATLKQSVFNILQPEDEKNGRIYIVSDSLKNYSLIISGDSSYTLKTYNLFKNYGSHKRGEKVKYGGRKDGKIVCSDREDSIALTKEHFAESLKIFFYHELYNAIKKVELVYQESEYEWEDENGVVHKEVEKIVSDIRIANEDELNNLSECLSYEMTNIIKSNVFMGDIPEDVRKVMGEESRKFSQSDS